MSKAKKPITPEHMERFALDIIKLLHRNHLFEEVNLYVNDKHYMSDPAKPSEFLSHDIDGITYYEEQREVDVTKQLEFCNPQTLSITFEGPLYHHVNYGNGSILEKMDKKAAAYGLFHEPGHAWSLSFYE